MGEPEDDKLSWLAVPTESLNLSEFATKLLDQLSVTSWLPAAVLTVNGAILVAVARANSVDVNNIAMVLDGAPRGVLVTGLLLTLVFLTMMTQAFELAACRVLQGRTSLLGPVCTLLVWLQERRLTWLRRRRDALIRESWSSTRELMLRKKVRRDIVDDLEAILLRLERSETSKEKQAKVITGWERYVSSAAMIRWRDLDRRIREYPTAPPFMPTLIGNLFRVLEDSLRQPGADRPRNKVADLDSFLFLDSSRLSVPERLVLHYRTAKSRLDMHCTLVFAFLVLAVGALGLALDGGVGNRPAGGLALAYLALAGVSYGAALRMTRHFVPIARAVARQLNSTSPS